MEKVLIEGEVNLVFEKWSKLTTSYMYNMINNAKVNLGGGGYIDSILKSKKKSRYDYIHNSWFFGQGSDLVYIFNTFVVEQGSGMDLVKRIQKIGDFEKKFIMFDKCQASS